MQRLARLTLKRRKPFIHPLLQRFHIQGDACDGAEGEDEACAGCLKRLQQKHHKQRQRVIPSEMTVSLSELEDFIAGEDEIAKDFDAARLGRVISDFIRSLSDRRQLIFMNRYYICEPIDTIAKELRLSRSSVNKELAAIRRALKAVLEREGYNI